MNAIERLPSQPLALEPTQGFASDCDPLTGLPNRRLFRHLLQQALTISQRHQSITAVLLLDLDRFKSINNSFGHDVGDQLLHTIAVRLRNLLGLDGIMARFGGDEFIVMLPNLRRLESAIKYGEKILSRLAEPLSVANCRELVLGGSLGIAWYQLAPTSEQPQPPPDSEVLLYQANMALELAKHSGGDTYALFTPELARQHHDDLKLHQHLRIALSENHLQLHYQPQIDSYSGRIIGAEALLRWHDPQLGQVPPARFIPVAEATGLITALSDWVMAQACKQLAAWQEAGYDWRLAVNLSVQQFRRPDLVHKLQHFLRQSGALPQMLDLEITESAAMDNLELAGRQLRGLQALGVGIALDDFGTGYSSLAYLKSLPIGKLKIDRTFIDELEYDASSRVIVRTIIALARGLKLQLVAEGVENERQLSFLREHGCGSCQGWLFAPALPAGELIRQFG